MFSCRTLNLFGDRLFIALVYNPDMEAQRMARLDRMHGCWFITLGFGHRFLNIDWIGS